MTLVLTPRLVLVEGRGGAGRTTISQKLAERITNAVLLTRDTILYSGELYMRHVETPNLISIDEYIGRAVLPEYKKVVETPFGPMIRVDHTPPNDFHARHTQKQSYLIAGGIAKDNLSLGKVVIIDGFLPHHIADGELQRFLEQPQYANFPKRLIHVVVSEDECWRRWQERAKTDPEAAIRGQFWAKNPEVFQKLMERHAMRPKGLEELPHLYLDTTGQTIDDCVEQCLSYIKN